MICAAMAQHFSGIWVCAYIDAASQVNSRIYRRVSFKVFLHYHHRISQKMGTPSATTTALKKWVYRFFQRHRGQTSQELADIKRRLLRLNFKPEDADAILRYADTFRKGLQVRVHGEKQEDWKTKPAHAELKKIADRNINGFWLSEEGIQLYLKTLAYGKRILATRPSDIDDAGFILLHFADTAAVDGRQRSNTSSRILA